MFIFIVTSAKEVMFLSLFVCLSVSNCAKTSERICVKFSGKVGNGPLNEWLNFDGDPDQVPDTDLDPHRNVGKTFLDWGMHCPSASSFDYFYWPLQWSLFRFARQCLYVRTITFELHDLWPDIWHACGLFVLIMSRPSSEVKVIG